jgi:hypothetical protein
MSHAVRLLLVSMLSLGLATAYTSDRRSGQAGEVEHLSSVARNGKGLQRSAAIGRLIRHIRVGMTREQVERLIGPPHQDNKPFGIEDGVGSVTYIYLDPVDGEYLLFVLYDMRYQAMPVVGIQERVPRD